MGRTSAIMTKHISLKATRKTSQSENNDLVQTAKYIAPKAT